MKKVLVVSLLGLVSSVAARSQASAGFGAVSGVVIQAGMDTMPEAEVVLSNAALGTRYTMISTDDGVFNSPTVVPSTGYVLDVSKKGYRSWQSGTFTVSAGQTAEFKVALEAAGTTNEMEAGMLPVDANPAGTSDVVTPEELERLPASGRRLDGLVPLAPAVTTALTQPGVMVTRGLPFSNIALTDGVDTTNNYFLEKPGLAGQVPQDAVETFQVLSDNFSLEYGRAMGGIVNTATRSGGTGYHGSAYEYFRSRGLESKDPYAAGYDTRQLQHQAGANVGGPIYGDQLFFFANLEALYRNEQGLNRITSPLIADPTGRFVLASNCTATAAQCAAATRFLQSQMNVLEPESAHSLNGFAKIDYRRSDRNSFSFDASAAHWRAPSLAQSGDVAPNGGLIGDPTQREESRFAKIGWIGTVSAETLNDLRIGVFEDKISEYPSGTKFSTGLLGIDIAGTNVGATLPYTTVVPSERRYQMVENLHFTSNSHLFQVGADLSKTQDYVASLFNPAGAYTYNSLTAFAQDFSGGGRNYTSFNQTFGNPVRTLGLKEAYFYGGDTWKASQRFTAEFGFGYQRYFLPQPTAVSTSYFQTASISSPWLDFTPRAALAYMVNERTVVRVGYGFYYAPFPGQLLDTLFLGNGVYQTNISVNPNQSGAPAFPAVVPLVTKIPTGTGNVVYATSSLRNPHAQQGNLAIERRVGKDATLTIGYINSRGYRLWTAQDVNLTTPTKTETYTIDNSAGQAVGTFPTSYWTARDNANNAHVYQVDNGGSSWYNALTMQWRMRIQHGFNLWASYTWSHSTDNLGVNSAQGFALPSHSGTDYNADKGPSAFDQRQRAVVRWTWDPALPKGSGATARYLLNGWTFSGLLTLASGQPVTPLVMVQGQQFSGATMDYTTSLNGAGLWNRVPFESVGSLHTAPVYNVDARLARSLPLTERIKGTVALEVFNLMNRQAATAINAIAFVAAAPLAAGLVNGPTAGVIKPVATAGQGIASQSFPDGTNARRCQLALKFTF
ncbi:MAG TPA: carboxypeptidase regulatory-like domain-containing protein [Candidatus Acidoferrales bacterium]|nr:carboxypeptidase regulatory-like domain-containing protein [Candidatus Acidoferrales bacterium]